MNIHAKPSVTTGALPASTKMFTSPKDAPDIRVAHREVELHPSAMEPPVRIYDTSGPYSDPTAERRRVCHGRARTGYWRGGMWKNMTGGICVRKTMAMWAKNIWSGLFR